MTATSVIPAVRRTRWGVGSLPPVTVTIALVILAGVIVMVLFPGIAPLDPDRIDAAAALQGPSAAHWLGTDELGRDVLSRVIAGARTAFLAPLGLATGTVALSLTIGLIAGYAGGWVDTFIGRIVDVLYAVPALLVAIVVVGVTGGGFVMAIVILTIFGLPSSTRLFRAAAMERVRLPYIEAARTVGTSPVRILFTQMLPTLRPLIVATLFLQFTYGLIEVSTLSFLGLGVPPGASDWGRMMFENRASISANAWATIAPAVLLVLLAVSTNVVGDWLYNRYEAKERQR